MKLINSNKRFSNVEITVDHLAAQLTLIDLPIFKAIQRNEFINQQLPNNHPQSRHSAQAINSTTTNTSSELTKEHLAPNIVSMHKQFNQLSFWVVGQILTYDSPRVRAELISQFIKTAKRLLELNNLHSTYAIVSALSSTPVHRLDKTWIIVKRKYLKERQYFDQITELFSDNNNYLLLRNHLQECDLPCIPYLGIYSRDLIYISEAYQDGTPQRTRFTNKILDSIERFQTSQYEELVYLKEPTRFLLANRYLDELQKFVEDENYRRSMELEPNTTDSDTVLDSNNNAHSTLDSSLSSRHKRLLLARFSSILHHASYLASSKSGYKSNQVNEQTSATSHNNNTIQKSTTQDSTPGPLHKAVKYLIDDSFMNNHTNRPPISTSN